MSVLAPTADGVFSAFEYTPSPADPKDPQRRVGGRYEIPNIPENKNAVRFRFGTD